MKYQYSLFILISITSCSVKTTENKEEIVADSIIVLPSAGFDPNNYETMLDLENYNADENSPIDSAQVIDETCAIIINPTEEQLLRMENEYGEDFYTITDDNSYYQAEASMNLDSLQIKTVNAGKHFLKLKGGSETWVLDVRKEGAPEWNIIFFHKEKKPEIVSSINVTTEKINQYFNK